MADKTRTILGLDPGLGGGVAVYRFDGAGLEELSLSSMPIAPGGSGKDEIDVTGLTTFLGGFGGWTSMDLVVIERVGAMRKGDKGPTQGVTSAFTFGMGYGKLLGVVEFLGLRSERPASPTWKKVVLAGTQKDKAAAVALVRRRFPKTSLLRTAKCRTPHDGMADAACLTLYGRWLLTGTL